MEYSDLNAEEAFKQWLEKSGHYPDDALDEAWQAGVDYVLARWEKSMEIFS